MFNQSLLNSITSALPQDLPIYLVGGAVRDALLGRTIHDYDFVMPGNALLVGRKVANRLHAAYYPLDEERYTARILISQDQGARTVLDFAALRGPDLKTDLRLRDFTLNAIAVDIRHPDTLIDPLGGAQDLRQKILRVCSPTSVNDDPVRILRAIRLASAFDLHIDAETVRLMRQAVPRLSNISVERGRDELFRLLDGKDPAAAIRSLDVMGALAYILPELTSLKGETQSAPHISDVWEHTLHVVEYLNQLLIVLGPQHSEDKSASLALGLAVMRLGRYREQIAAHLIKPLNSERSPRALLFLAALYHDSGKPQMRQEGEGGKIHFYEHDQAGEDLAGLRGLALHLSNAEIDRLRRIVRYHMRPLFMANNIAKNAAKRAASGLTNEATGPSRKAIYRFFRAAGEAGVDICLLSLADTLGTYGVTLPPETWERHLDVIRSLLDAWWENHTEMVSPPVLVTGNDLMDLLGITPGPLVGKMLEGIREGQATGQIRTREEALAAAREMLNQG